MRAGWWRVTRCRFRFEMRGVAWPSPRAMAATWRWISSPSIAACHFAASTAADLHGGGGIGGLLLTFDRESAPTIARREDYDAYAFERLIGLAERVGKPLGRVPDGDRERNEFRPAHIPDGAALDARLHVAGIYFPSDRNRRRPYRDYCDRFGIRRQRRSEDCLATPGIRDGPAAVARGVAASRNSRFRSRGTDRILRGVHSRRIAWAGRRRPGGAIRSGGASGARDSQSISGRSPPASATGLSRRPRSTRRATASGFRAGRGARRA